MEPLLERTKWCALLLALVWAYGPMLWDVARQCAGSLNYAHGFLVPLFSLGFLWLRRKMLRDLSAEGSWWGMALLIVAAVLEFIAARWSVLYLHRLSLLPCLAGVMLLVWGWRALRWSGPSIAFLAFMYPFPLQFGFLFSESLQRLGAVSSAFVLQVIGVPAFTEGTIIVLRDSQVEVADACSGIRILGGCCVVALGLVVLTRHRFGLKALVVASAVPIALGANIARITLTAIVQASTHQVLTHGAVHDLLGVCTPVLAVGLLFGELQLLKWLSRGAPVEEEPYFE